MEKHRRKNIDEKTSMKKHRWKNIDEKTLMKKHRWKNIDQNTSAIRNIDWKMCAISQNACVFINIDFCPQLDTIDLTTLQGQLGRLNISISWQQSCKTALTAFIVILSTAQHTCWFSDCILVSSTLVFIHTEDDAIMTFCLQIYTQH